MNPSIRELRGSSFTLSVSLGLPPGHQKAETARPVDPLKLAMGCGARSGSGGEEGSHAMERGDTGEKGADCSRVAPHRREGS